MILFKKQKQLLDKSIQDYLHREKDKDTFNKAIVEYEKPYSYIESIHKTLEPSRCIMSHREKFRTR